ncbi:hypothetical protein [Escherichia coli]
MRTFLSKLAQSSIKAMY